MVRLSAIKSRSLEISWSRPHDGNSPILNYIIEYRKSIDHGNADALSRLPAGEDKDFDQFCQDEEQTERFVANMELQFIKDGPIQFEHLKRYTNQDPVLQQVATFISQGWPKHIHEAEIKPYAACRHQLSSNESCLLKHGDGTRLVVPTAIRPQLLKQLRRAHIGTEETI